jgi:GDPmannose 4,6-dehydratase
MWRILQQDSPEDFVIATGETHTVREFAELTFDELGMPLRWEGSEAEEKGISRKTGEVLVKVDPQFYRPTEVDFLAGDASKAGRKLGWKSRTAFADLVRIMARADDAMVSGKAL